jgi:DNA-binding beta-propeller fold protein YncE
MRHLGVCLLRMLGFFVLFIAPSVHAQAPPTPPGRYLAVSLLGEREVGVFTLPDLSRASTLHTGFQPDQLTAFDSQGRLYVFPLYYPDHGRRRDEIIDFDLKTGAVRTRLHTPSPFTGQLSEDGAKLYVTKLDAGGATIISTTNDAVTGVLTTTSRPDYMALDAARHELYVADNQNSVVTVYDTQTDQSLRQFTALAIQQIVVAAGKIYWTTGGNVVKVNDAITFAPLNVIPLAYNPLRLRRSLDGGKTWVLTANFVSGSPAGEVVGIDTASDTVVSSTPYLEFAGDFVVDDASAIAYLALGNVDAVGVLDLSSGAQTNAPIGRLPSSLAIVTVPAPSGP